MMNNLKTSARNCFKGQVGRITPGAVNAEVVVDCGGQEIVSIITNGSVKHLALKEGLEVYALVKASWVILTAADSSLKVSARNHFEGTVKKIEKGAVNSEVVIELPKGPELAAIITNHSVESLGLKEGGKAGAMIKASHVILAVAS